MHRDRKRGTSVFVRITAVIMLLITGLVGATGASFAENSSGFPDDLIVEELGIGDVPANLPGSSSVYLERVAIAPGASLPAREISATEVLYIEEGTLMLIDSFGLSSPLGAGKSVQFRAGPGYNARNESTANVSILRLGVTTTGSDSGTGLESDGVSISLLAQFTLADLPDDPAVLFLDRVTWVPGADTGPYVQNGPIGMLTESGTLTISSPSGLEGQLSAGNTAVLPVDQTLRARNDGESDAIVLLFGVVPADGTVVSGDTGSARTSSKGGAGAVLYHADTTGGFADWKVSSDWTTVGGMLVNNGTGNTAVYAPFQPTTANYAVEAEIQWVRGGKTFGVVTRAGDETGYLIGFGPNCSNRAFIWAANVQGQEYCSSIAYTGEKYLDGNWHLLRIEVNGNVISFWLDGAKILETSDNLYLAAGRVGLWSNGAQISVRSFTVISLGQG